SAISGTASSSIWAVGHEPFVGSPKAITYHYNGTSWKSFPAPSLKDSSLYGVSASATLGVWAVGSYQDDAGNAVTLILKREPPNWVQIPSPSVSGQGSVLNDIRMVSPTLGWAVGTSSDDSGNAYPLIEQWNGATWSIVPADPAVPNGMLFGIR